jgi:superfamily II DNA or RNA helicase
LIWDYIANNELQQYIGIDILRNLREIIPTVTNIDYDDFNINKKEVLVKIINAFLGHQFFRKKSNLTDLLYRIPEEIINKCITSVFDADISKPFEDKVKLIIDKWNNVKYNKKLLEWAGLPTEYKKEVKKKEASIVSIDVPDHPYKTLKDYQMSVYIQADDKLKFPTAHFMVQMPTGSGKTRTAMEIVTNYINEQDKEIIVLWLAHSADLCDQAEECFREIWEHVAKKELAIYKCWGGYNFPQEISGNSFIIGGFQKLYTLLQKNKNIYNGIKSKIGLIIIDEAHKVTAPTYSEVVRTISNLNTKVIGLTATPGRDAKDLFGNKELSDYFHNENITINTREEKISIIEYLRKKKVLSNLNIESIIPSSKYELTKKDLKYMETYFDFPSEFLKKLGDDNIRNIEIIRRLEKECKNKRQIIFFACGLEHSKFICSMLIYLGFNAAHVDGNTDHKSRINILKDFKNNKI